MRLNVADDIGRVVAGRYGLTAVPAFLVFREGGAPSERFVGYPDQGKLMRALLGT